MQFDNGTARTGMAMIAVVMVLTGCPGGGGSSSATSAVDDAQAPGADNPAGMPDASASFFGSIFINGRGSGYYQFVADNAFRISATVRSQFYVNTSAETKFGEMTSTILGSYTPEYREDLYVTDEGAFTARFLDPTISALIARFSGNYRRVFMPI
ncbi:hypothetical protein R75461_07856 [Paraburkholderia nemoris]|uniref:hypothetical protein n=1 Tax=Paraburkholderia nemoris TaxID=2793076 RepID=UPI00190CA30F|nr:MULTISPECIES: hypothetical protein [Paraburkholderia]MBK3786864.1 hypothetical protein [Paraburkholderia aspalathi]CAE6858569.1 hypothetical protein R75461_07856 [Paraburkholderia nemoris]